MSGAGQQSANDGAADFNAISFIAKQVLALIHTATMVQVVACTNSDAVSAVGYVDVLPLVNPIDGAGSPVPHGTVFNLPYARLQGGDNAVILDPKPGDIGVAVFAERDISSAKKNKAQSNPGSLRRFSMADGIYLGMILNAAPTQYVRFSDSGIFIVSPTLVQLQAPTVKIEAPTVQFDSTTVTVNVSSGATVNGNFIVNGPTTLNGPITQGSGTGGTNASFIGPISVTNDVTAGGKSVSTHTHPDPQGGNTGPPN